MEYKTVKGYSQALFVERKSEFIGHIKHVENSDEAFEFISEIKTKHRDATHNVYAFALRDGTRRYSDDGEPQGTAGMPVLNVIVNEELFNVCVVVTRYFGGIMLGAGGLVRAYSNGCKLAVDSAEKLVMAWCASQEIIFDYSLYNRITLILEEFGASLTDSVFEDLITLRYLIRAEKSEELNKCLSEVSSGKIIPDEIARDYFFIS